MAARRPRPEKKILSKQEVSSRKKALAVRRVEGTGVGHRALVGVALLALSSLALVALLTEPGAGWRRGRAHNGAGPVGHALAALLGGFLGIAAPAIPLAGRLRLGRPAGGQAREAALAAGARRAGAAGGDLRAGPARASGRRALHPRNPPGGALGVEVSAWLLDLFEVLGTVIVVSAVAFAAMLVATQFALLRAVAALGHVLAELGGEGARRAGGAVGGAEEGAGRRRSRRAPQRSWRRRRSSPSSRRTRRS